MLANLLRYYACRTVRDRLWNYAEGTLPARQAHHIENHVRSCPSCAAEVDGFRKTTGLLAAARALPIAHPRGAWPLLRGRIHHAQMPASAAPAAGAPVIGPRLAEKALPWCTAVLAVCAAAVLLGHLASLSPEKIPSHQVQQAQRDQPSLPPDSPVVRLVRHGTNPSLPKAPGLVARPRRTEDGGGSVVPSPVHYAHGPGRRQTGVAADRTDAQDDLALLNARADSALARWMDWPPGEAATWKAKIDDTMRKTKQGDDFVQVPFPQIASTEPKALIAARDAYQNEKQIVDVRLSRTVTLAVKDMALGDLCHLLTQRTGIELKADKSVGDENVTLFGEDLPLREIMRQINRLFGFSWARLGEEGTYRYELSQDLRGRLMEEEMRDHDFHQAMIALDEKVRDLIRKGDTPMGDRWAGLKAYEMLSPADREALDNGEKIDLSMDSDNPDRRIPSDMRVPLLKATSMYLGAWAGEKKILKQRVKGDEPPIAGMPDAMPTVGLHIDRTEAGELSLMVDEGAYLESSRRDGIHVSNVPPGPSSVPIIQSPMVRSLFGILDPVARATSPSGGNPDNARAQQAHRNEPLFKRIVSLKPVSSCPCYAPDGPHTGRISDSDDASFDPKEVEKDGPHVFSGDVWEALHRATGMPVIADSYSRYYRTPDVSTESVPLFNALCKACDAMGVRWKTEDAFLAGRSTSFVWDKIKEVPNRLLVRWRDDAHRSRGLPLDDLLEMASLTDVQLGSSTVGKVIEHCFDLPEWSIVGNGHIRYGMLVPEMLRPHLRFVASLSSQQRRAILQPDGLLVDVLSPAQKQNLAAICPREVRKGWLLPTPGVRLVPEPGTRLRVEYVPAGLYTWHPYFKKDRIDAAKQWPMVSGKTPEEALAAARRLYPEADTTHVIRSKGDFCLVYLFPDGHAEQVGRVLQLAQE